MRTLWLYDAFRKCQEAVVTKAHVPSIFPGRAPYHLSRPRGVHTPKEYIKGKVSGSTSVSEVPPAPLLSLTHKCTHEAIYRFEIGRDGKVIKWYVGETADFSIRIRHYVGMTRRMLCLHDKVPLVVLEKHPMRNIHHHLAEALVVGDTISICWDKLSLPLKRCRVAFEDNERALARSLWPDALELNCKLKEGNFEVMPRPSDEAWGEVHDRLLTCPYRRGKKPPFVV